MDKSWCDSLWFSSDVAWATHSPALSLSFHDCEIGFIVSLVNNFNPLTPNCTIIYLIYVFILPYFFKNLM